MCYDIVSLVVDPTSPPSGGYTRPPTTLQTWTRAYRTKDPNRAATTIRQGAASTLPAIQDLHRQMDTQFGPPAPDTEEGMQTVPWPRDIIPLHQLFS